MTRPAPILLAVCAIAMLTACAAGDEASPGVSSGAASPSVEPDPSTEPEPSTESDPDTAPQPSEGTAPGDDPAVAPEVLTVGPSADVTYLVAQQGDSDAIAHEVVLWVDDAACLRADVADRGDGLFAVLPPTVTVTADGIADDTGLVVPFGEPVTAMQMATGTVPADYVEVCGDVDTAQLFGAAGIER